MKHSRKVMAGDTEERRALSPANPNTEVVPEEIAVQMKARDEKAGPGGDEFLPAVVDCGEGLEPSDPLLSSHIVVQDEWGKRCWLHSPVYSLDISRT